LQPAGTGGALEASIRQAIVLADPPPKRTEAEVQGLKSGTRLTAQITLDVKYTRRDGAISTASVHIQRSTTMPSALRGADLDRAYYGFAKDLAGDLDKELQIQVAERLREALL